MFKFHLLPPGRQWHQLQIILSCQGDQYSHIDTLNVKIHPLFQIQKTKQDVARSLVPILASTELVAPIANNPIILGRSIPLLKDLKDQNLCTCDDFIDRSGIIFLVPFLVTMDAMVLIVSGTSIR